MIVKYGLILLAASVMACCAGKKSAHYKPISFEEGDTTILAGATNPVWGRWIIYKYEWGLVSAFTDAEADSLIGHEMIVLPDSFMFGNDTCRSPVYRRFEEDAEDELLTLNHIKPEKLGVISERVVIVEVSCSDAEANPPGSYPEHQIYFNDEHQFVLPLEGLFFFFRKEDR